MTPEGFDTGMNRLMTNWPRENFPAERSAGYADALQDLHDSVWIEAVRRALREATYFPTPAELRDYAEQVLERAGQLPVNADTAWQEVMRLAKHWYPGLPGRTGNAIADECIAQHGGIRGIALADDRQIGQIERGFKRQYTASREAAIEIGMISQALRPAPGSTAALTGSPDGDGRNGDSRREEVFELTV